MESHARYEIIPQNTTLYTYIEYVAGGDQMIRITTVSFTVELGTLGALGAEVPNSV